ncbi:type I methionyl aminopeptidase [Spirochaeta africana]|uniref:Methionine aminopeptidase n=1 Tax=Spirochaeta africana (strain ATCC 700263 / DSM 8902 / Z-7692) TaxID=889378 RepID=H9UJI9_SPIAZ|nr:type I methionyl aminopeptidase [Spirochaeta africana]AFG37682.1 methionine aminopeptidase, type I [Spirochaeta africana DSM 8902]
MIKIKNRKQIEGIRTSCLALGETLDIISAAVQPGITTGELDGLARREIKQRGGRPAFLGYMGFPGALCISVNEEVIHGIPGKRRLAEGDIVSIDCGIDLNGFYSDSAVTVPVGRVSEKVEKLLEVTEQSLYLGIEQMLAGNRIKDVSRAIYRHIDQYGFGVVHEYCGHGVGIDIHEDPQVPNYVGPGPNPRLKNGMVLAVEPMVTLGSDDVDVLDDDWTVVSRDRSLAAHFEHTVLVWDDAPEILTRRPSMH